MSLMKTDFLPSHGASVSAILYTIITHVGLTSSVKPAQVFIRKKSLLFFFIFCIVLQFHLHFVFNI